MIHEEMLDKNVIVHGTIQHPKDNTLVLIIDNLGYEPFDLTNFSPPISATQNCQMFPLKKKKNEPINDQEKLPLFNISSDDRIQDILKKLNISDKPLEIQQLIQKICEHFSDLMHLEGDPMSKVSEFSHKIYLKPNSVPFYVKQYRLSPNAQKVLTRKVREMLKQDLVEP
jgi:hypothetical protein